MPFSQEDAKSCNDEIHDYLADVFILMTSSTNLRESQRVASTPVAIWPSKGRRGASGMVEQILIPGHPQSDIQQLTISELTPQNASSDRA